jgi:hypothetical protein
VRDIATDAAGNAYLTGGTQSSNFPTTSGALQRVSNPGTPQNNTLERLDVFIVKMDPNGNIIWSTLLGGPNYDRAYGIAVDAQGSVYVAGRAGAGFPVTPGAFQTTFQGGQEATNYGPQDGFVCKIKPDGSAIVYCTYFGTSDPRIIRDLAVNSQGEVYIASGWNSGNYPGTTQSKFVNTPRGGSQDAILAKISADGSQVLWARYMGGSDYDSNQNSVGLDGSGNPYILFTTKSRDVQVSGNAYQKTFGGDADVFVAKMNASNGAFVWGTYFGGSGNESTETHEFAVDAAGNAYIAAPTTTTSGFPTTANAFRRSYSGGPSDIYVAKFSPDGSTLVACTLLGGSGTDAAEGMSVDGAGNVFFTGQTSSSNFPVTSDAAQKTLRGGMDAIAVKLSSDFSRLDYSSYLGGSGLDYGRAAAVGANGFYLGGESFSSDLLTVNANQSAFGGAPADALVARVRF